MINNNNINIIPIIQYNNLYTYKLIIYKDNKNKSEIYRWTNLINGKSYIRSAKSLNKRFYTYFSKTTLQNKLKKGRSAIYNSLLKYGYENFSLDILEYCDLNFLITRKQYYIDLLKPEYNILKTAGSRLGTKHCKKTIEKFKNRGHSYKTIVKIK